MKIKTFCSLALAATLASVLPVSADTLELRDGQIIQGKFIGGSALNIRFQINGQEQVFATKDVLNIGFSDTSVQDSTAVAPANPSQPPASALPNSPSPQPDATSSQSANLYPAPSSDSQTPPPTQAAPSNLITIPAGTSLLVRMVDSVDSSKNQIGDTFEASLESPLMVGDIVVAEKGAYVFGKLARVKSAGKISGGAELTLQLTGIRVAGDIVPIDSTTYDVAGKGRGKQSAERIGGGAALGAIIGGIAGGGAGAAIGAGVGAAAGTTVQLATHGEKIRVPSETLLEFKLDSDVTTRIVPAGQ
jgi:hypothetical protein